MSSGVYPRTEKPRQKISKGKKKKIPKNIKILKNCNKGKKHTKEHNKRISENKKGHKTGMTGKNHAEKTKKKISEKMKGKYEGNKNPNWQGGISFEPYTIDWTETLKRSIRERDHYTCQLCNQYGNAVHHIDYNKKNCNLNNLITLCRSCNSKVNFNRKYWYEQLYKRNKKRFNFCQGNRI